MYLLITGASGHIGSAIAHECNFKKIKTILLTRSPEKKKQLKKKFKNCLVKTLAELNKKDKINAVIHTASLNDRVSNSDKNSIKTSIKITKNIFSKLKTKNLNKIIYLSTAQVYGSNLTGKVDENTKTKPINNYGLSRLENEKYLKKLSRKFRINLLILRISNVVGEPIFKNKECLRLLPNDIKYKANKIQSVILKSSGLQFRNFISLSSTAKIITKLSKINIVGTKIYNLGGTNTSVLNFVKEFIKNFEKLKKKKLRFSIQSNQPIKIKKLSYRDYKLRKYLRINRKETLGFIIKKFLQNKYY